MLRPTVIHVIFIGSLWGALCLSSGSVKWGGSFQVKKGIGTRWAPTSKWSYGVPISRVIIPVTLLRGKFIKVITPFISHLIVHPKYVSLPGIVGKHGNQPSLIVHSGLLATTTLAITKSCSRTFFNFQHFPAVLVQVFDGHFPHSESIQRCDMFFFYLTTKILPVSEDADLRRQRKTSKTSFLLFGFSHISCGKLRNKKKHLCQFPRRDCFFLQ